MGAFGWKLAGCILLAVAVAASTVRAQQMPAPPDFSSNGVGWAALARGPTFAPYRRVQQEMLEEPCGENIQHFDWPIPIAQRPDF